MKLLLVDDNPAQARLLHEMLKEAPSENIELKLADRLDSAFDAIRGDPPDVVLLDLGLPDSQGIDTLLKAQKAFPAIPFVVLTGLDDQGFAVEAVRAGAQDYLVKGRINCDVLVRTTRYAVERQRSSHALLESEARFQNLAKHSNEVFWFVALHPQRVSYVSPAVEKIWGLPAARFYEDPHLWTRSIHPDDQARAHAAFEAMVAGTVGRLDEEYRVIRTDGAIRWVSDRGTPICGDGNSITSVGGVVRDITERKAAEELQLRTQRLENIGMLAAGIAHDLNNVLAPIMMAGSLLQPHVANPGAQNLLVTVEKCATRGAGLVRQLMSFARGSSSRRELLQVGHVLKELIELAERTFPKSICVKALVPDKLWPVEANSTQVQQVFLNLCINARDAMPDGGELTIIAANRMLDAATAAGMEDAHPGAFLTVEIRDTGTGIPPDVLARIWEPFYTTKGEGKGTGLGLSTVRGIVHQHDGFIAMQTKVGCGTAFTVHLPAKVDKVAVTQPLAARSPRGKGELILVVDDEEPIRQLATDILTDHGFEVVTAHDGADAIAVFMSRPEKIKLLLSDLVMPALNGLDLATALRRLNPDLPFIAMSDSGSKTSESYKNFAASFLAKPFQAETLLSIVHRTLDEARPPVVSPRAASSIATGTIPLASILVVDDDSDFVDVVVQTLRQAGYTADSARDGKAGLSLYRAGQYDLIITDMMMPEMDGLAFLTALRHAVPRPRSIAVSGNSRLGMPNYLPLAEKFGAMRSLQKPIQPDVLLQTVAEVLAAPPPPPIVDSNKDATAARRASQPIP
jgi:two-component system cell cycle sensor histidine kinase/response regulator CckA